jgi:hypothetical protein
MVGVEVRVKDIRNPHAVFLGHIQVSVDVPLGVDDTRHPLPWTTDEIRIAPQPLNLELLKEHARTPVPIRASGKNGRTVMARPFHTPFIN